MNERPGSYFQAESDGQPVGGLVMYDPRKREGIRRFIAVNPFFHLTILVIVGVAAMCGILYLVAQSAWQWGGIAGLVAAAFITCLSASIHLGRDVLIRARLWWIARQNDCDVIEGLWAEPDVLPTLMAALAKERPGKRFATKVSSENQTAYRTLGLDSSKVPGVAIGALAP